MSCRFLKNLFYFILLLDAFCWQAQGQPFRLSKTFGELSATITCLTTSVDDQILIAGDEAGNLIFIDPKSGKINSTIKAFTNSVGCINFNSTGRLMVVASHDGELKIYDFLQEKFIQSLYSPDYSDVRFALFSIADGFIYFNGQGRLYKTRSDLSQVPVKIFEFDSVITNAIITDDRSALLFSCNNSIKVINTRTDQMMQELNILNSPIDQLNLSSNKLVTWSRDGTITIHNYLLNQLSVDPLISFKAGNSGRIAFSHDGNLMVTGNVGNWARIWKPFERSVVQELFGHKSTVNNFTFSKDDKTLYTASSDKTIKAWTQDHEEKRTDRIVSDLPEHINPEQPAAVDSAKTQSSISIPGKADLPVIELNKDLIPDHVGERKVDKTTVVEIDQPSIDIFVFDNSTLDGDVMSLSFQNQWIMAHYTVTKKKKKITLELIPGSNNYLVLFADNLGKTPPNTAVISFVQNGKEKIFRLESDLKSCSAINFIYKKK